MTQREDQLLMRLDRIADRNFTGKNRERISYSLNHVEMDTICEAIVEIDRLRKIIAQRNKEDNARKTFHDVIDKAFDPILAKRLEL